MVYIYLNYNLGYKWFNDDKIYVKGYIFDKFNKLFTGYKLIDYFKDVNNEQKFLEKIKEANGIFSVIIKIENKKVFFATDITRTFPIYYYIKDNSLYISDDAFYLKEKLSLKIDKLAEEEFLTTGFVTGNFTLVKNLYQVQAGEYIYWDGEKLKNKMYFYYCTNKYKKKPYTELKKDLISILDRVINRLIIYTDGKRIVIPLSGGYDSRLIATLLKDKNYKNVFCFTYGKPDSFEVKISQKVAKALGYDWYFVEYNEKTIPKNYNKERYFYEYIKFGSNMVVIAHIQDFFAIKSLVENNIINKDCIVVPGHTGDFLSTGHLSNEILNLKSPEKMILKKHYIFRDEISNSLKEKIKSLLPLNNCISHTIAENFNQKERQAKFIVNANRVYEFFGLKHVIPLWDKELVEFFRTLPLEYKLNCRLYEDVLLNDIFKKHKVDIKKKKSTINIIRNILPTFFKKIIKKNLKNINFSDVNNFKLILSPILKDLKMSNFYYINYVLAVYVLEQIKNTYEGR